MGLTSVFARGALTAALLTLGLACDELPDIESDVCGNKLVEASAREACDGFAEEVSESELPTRCAEPGERFQCQYVHDADHGCPLGYGAGLDGLCREGVGQFSSVPTHSDFTGTHSAVADFDGDGRIDLLTSTPFATEAKVTYLGNGAAPRGSAVITLGDAQHRPVAGLLGADAPADIVAPGASGLLVLKGQSSLTFESKGYATTVLDVAVFPVAVPASALEEDVLLTGLHIGVHEAGAIVQAGSGLVIVAGYGDAVVVGQIPNADLDQVVRAISMDLDPPVPLFPGSEEIVIALREKQGSPARVVAVTPHVQESKRRYSTYVPTREFVTGPFKIGSRVGLAVGTGTARYAELLSLVGDELVAEERLISADEPDDGTPIGMGLFENDLLSVVFAILPRSIVIDLGFSCSVDSCFSSVAGNTSVYPWTAAAFDESSGVIVAGSFFTTGLDALRYNPGSLVLNALRLNTDAPVQTIDVGNFDGDLAVDFLIRTRVEAMGCDDDTRLSIAWGDAAGYPSEPTPLGDFAGLAAIAPGNYPQPLQSDSIGDFVVTRQCDDVTRAGMFLGDASRQLRAPFPVTDPLPSYSGLPNLGAAALLLLDVGMPGDGTADGIDDILVLVGEPPEIGVRPIFADGLAALEIGGELWSVSEEPDPIRHAGAMGSARMLSADVDDDGDSDVLVVMAVPGEIDAGGAVYTPAIWLGTNTGAGLSFEKLAEASAGFPFVVNEATEEPSAASAFFYSASLLTEVVLVDVNADDQRDIVLRVALPGVVGIADSVSYPFVFLSTGAGGYEQTELELPEGMQGLAGVAGAVPGAELALATGDDVLLCSGEGGFGCESLGITAGSANVGLTVADFDGDGVADLAVAREEGTSFYRQLTAQDGVSNAE